MGEGATEGTTSERPLDGVRVIERASHIAGPMLGKLFVDAGADVIKIETRDGDPLRRFTATATLPDGDDGPLFRFLGADKRSVLAAPDGPSLHALLAGADLLIDDGDPTLDIDALRAQHPHLVIVSISPFGRTGPWAGRPATDLTIQAEGGGLQFRGPLGRPPVQAGGRITEFLGGTFAAAPALAAVLAARAGGDGTHIDLSIHDVMALAGTNHLDLVHQLTGAPEVSPPVRVLDTPGIERASDGLVAFNCNAGHMMQMFLVLIGQGELIDDPVWLSLNERLARGAQWQSMIDAWTTAHSVDEIIDAAVDLRIPVAPCHDGASILTDQQLAARGAFVTGRDGCTRPRPPYLLDGRPLMPGDRVPSIGEHSEQVAAEIADGTWDSRTRPTHTTTTALPLAGLRVVDLTSWWVGALTTQILGRLGADVVHIEGPGHPDGMRLTGKIFATTDAWWEFGHVFTAVDTDRRGVVLDLDTDDGRDALWTLIERADFLVENFAPRVAERWGLTHEAVLERNPEIVYLRMPAFGLDGPWRDRPAFAQTIEPMSTMSSITGFADGLPVSKGGLPDPVGGSTGAWAALVAHAQRLRTGRGVAVESVMLEAAVNACAQPLLEYAATGEVMGRAGNRSPHAAPQGVYPTNIDGQWLALSVVDDDQWRALATALGVEELADDRRFATHEARAAAHGELDTIIAAWVATNEAEDAADLLCAAGVPAGMCRDPRLLRRHPQYIGRRLFEDMEHPVIGTVAVPGQPHRTTGIERWIGRPTPTFGQHTDEVLAEAGMAPEQVADLRARDIITDRPRGV